MSRKVFNDGMEVIHDDFNEMGALAERTLFDRIVYELSQRAENSFFDDSFLVSYASPTSVTVNAGIGFQTDNTQVDPEPIRRMLYRASNVTLNLTAANGAQDRIDIVVVKADRGNETTDTRKFKDASTSVVSNESFTVKDDWFAELDIVDGTPAGSPVAPSTPAGYIKIAELYVTAVTGMSGSGDVTDTRTLMPVGGSLTIDTTGYDRLTASATLSLSQALSEVDAFLKNGYQEYTDYDVLGAAPSSLGASKVRLYHTGGVWYSKDSGGTITPLGSGGGGSGALKWTEAGNSPIAAIENSADLYLYEAGLGQELYTYIRVPSSYIAGRAISLKLPYYSPDTSGTVLLSAQATLLRPGTTAFTSTTNQRTTTNVAATLSATANRVESVTLDITSATGTINSVAVAPLDIIKVRVYRGTDTATSDVRALVNMTEVTLS